MSLAFKKNGDLEENPNGYFKGTRYIASYEYELQYKGKATEKTGKKWVGSIVGIGIGSMFMIMALALSFLEPSTPPIIDVALLIWGSSMFLVALANFFSWNKKVKEEIRLGLGEQERQRKLEEQEFYHGTYYENESENEKENKVVIKQEQWDGEKISVQRTELTSSVKGNRMAVLVFASMIVAFFAMLAIFICMPS